MKFFTYYSKILLVLSLLISPLTAGGKHFSEISSADRDQAAKKILSKDKGSALVFAKGLICPSCAIGIRKKLQRLKFVDTSKPLKGVILNAEKQLVVISMKPGATPDPASISKAIKGAGYDPVTLYTRGSSGKVQKTALK